jgi:hypothetical protein
MSGHKENIAEFAEIFVNLPPERQRRYWHKADIRRIARPRRPRWHAPAAVAAKEVC